jgi:sugar phosphate isomerase/epimerase
MARPWPRSQFYLSTYREHVWDLVRQSGVGAELLEFSAAASLERMAELAAIVLGRAAGIHPLAMHAPHHDLNPGSLDPMIRDVARARFGQALEIAGLIGVERVVFHSGYDPAAYRAEDWLVRAVGFWTLFLGSMDGKASPLLCIENVADRRPEPLRDLVDQVNGVACCAVSPRLQPLGVCLDIGHVNANSPMPAADWVTALGPRIGHVHLSNNDGLADRHWPLDRGTLDVQAVMELLAKHAPDATYTIEAADEVNCLRWLEAHGWIECQS